MNEPAISVLIPVRDGARYLAAAIESVLRQSPRPAEVIVVDDGSADDSAAIASGFGPPVRCLRRPARGIAAARNAAVVAAAGEFVAFLDSDDLWTDGALAALLGPYADDPELELAFGHVRQFLSPDVEPELGARLVVRPGLEPGYMAGGLLARRGAFATVGRFREDLVTGEMVDWMMRARELGVRQAVNPQHVLWRRIHGANHGRRQREARSDYVRVAHSVLQRRRAASGPGSPP